MKQFKQFLLALLVALTSCLNASAYDFEVDGIYYNTISVQDLTCEVTYKIKIGDKVYSSPYSGDIVIPSSVTYSGKTFSVTSIRDNTFRSCSSLTSVEIPNSVTSIGGNAFYKCTSLTSVVIPNSVTSMGISAFCGCSSLTSVKIPNSVTEIGYEVFSLCSSLTSVVIPNSVTSIGNWAFRGCSNLTSVVIGNSVTSIGRAAFGDCTSLTSVVIGNSVATIRDSAFGDCTSLTSVEIPNSVTIVGNQVFYGCSKLASVAIGNSVTSIGMWAFTNCSSLTSVVITNSVKTIGDGAFKGCTNLKGITSMAITPPSISSSTFEGVSKIESVVKVPAESVATYQGANYWKEFWNIVSLNSENSDGGDGGNSSDTEPETKQCAAPTIELVNDKLVAKSATEGAKCHISITSDDKKSVTGNKPIELTGVYNISSYAHAEGYQNSEMVTATLVWVNPTLEGSSVMSMEAKKAVLIRTQGGSIIVSGTERGEDIQLYSADGRQLCSVSAEDGQTVIPCNAGKGEVVILKMGQKTVEVAM